MLSFIKNLNTAFRPYELKPISDRLDNPGRGWYRIYTYHIGSAQVEEPVRYPGESLALVLLDIGNYQAGNLDQEALEQMRGIMNSFVNLGFDLILRICYDTEGKGMVREPSLFSQVRQHISQIAPILKEFAANIYVYQGLLVGNWGEMHESKFLSAKSLKELMEVLLKETEGKVMLSVRKPVQLRTAFSQELILDRRLCAKCGFFNDGILGSDTHLGTFAPATREKGAFDEMWNADDEIAFMDPFLNHVPYGGEVLKGPEKVSPEETEKTLRALRVSYLNSMHDERILSEWKSIPYGDGSFYDQVGMHLGYCFIICDTLIRKGRQRECCVTVENKGYGALYDETEAFLWLEGEQGPKELLGCFEGNLCGMHYGEKRVLRATFDLSDCRERAVSISMRRKKDHRSILFAQEAVEDRVVLGEFK